MIRVTAEPERLTVQGHAGFEHRGPEMEGSAGSALMLALCERLQEKNLVREPVTRPGYISVAMRGAEQETELVKCGLRQLERRFPQCVQVREK